MRANRAATAGQFRARQSVIVEVVLEEIAEELLGDDRRSVLLYQLRFFTAEQVPDRPVPSRTANPYVIDVPPL